MPWVNDAASDDDHFGRIRKHADVGCPVVSKTPGLLVKAGVFHQFKII